MKHLLLCGFLILLFTGCQEEDPVISHKFSTLTDSRDNRTYRYLEIGDQTWMMDNLAYLPEVNHYTNGSITEPRYYVYGYEDSVKAGAVVTDRYVFYGVLYNYEGAKTACPSGWHLPTDKEWKLLTTTLGMTKQEADSIGWSSSTTVGTALKSNTGWLFNGNGTNSSGFTALPAGLRSYGGLYFYHQGNLAHFWTSTENSADDAWLRRLAHSAGSVERNFWKKYFGMSVRCVKN
jgi:uncharacterized protein (TIGR02145 family)